VSLGFRFFCKQLLSLENDTGLVDLHFVFCNDHLMALVFYIHTQTLEFSHEDFDLFFYRIATHVTQVLERLTAENFVNCAGQSIGNGDLGFIARSKTRLEFSIFGPIIRSFFLLGAVCGLDQEFSEVRVAVPAF
jgi:hypothetical protein